MRSLLEWLADVALGPRCRACRYRVFPRDFTEHYTAEHPELVDHWEFR